MDNMDNTRGLTLVESLIAVLLVSVLLVGILGAFVISRLAVDRAKHRMMAMNTIRQYMEQEIKAGYLGGFGARDDGTVDTDYYLTVDSGDNISFIIDSAGSSALQGRIKPDPYPAETDEVGASPNTCRYKKIGFVVEWDERLFGGSNSRERAVAYVADHS